MTLSTQFVTLLSMIGMGISFAASFDTYNRFLQRATRGTVLVFVNDVLFWCIEAIVLFWVLFQANEGELRFYLLIALACGYAAYQSLLRKLYLNLLETTIAFIIRLAKITKQLFILFLVRPVYWLFTFCLQIVLMIATLLFFLLKSIFTIAKVALKAVLFIVSIPIKPIIWILSLAWSVLPRKFTWHVEAALIRTWGKCTLYFRKVYKFIQQLRAK